MVREVEFTRLEELYHFNIYTSERLSSGSLNEVFLLNTSSGKKIAKLYFKLFDKEWISSQENIQNFLSSSNLLPKNIVCKNRFGNFFSNLDSTVFTISNYFNYRTFLLRNENDIAKAARYLSDLHEMQVNISQNPVLSYELPEKANYMVCEDIVQSSKFDRDKIKKATFNSLMALQSIETLNKQISNIPWSIVHGDFHSNNILMNKKDLTVIDWDDSCYGPKIFDLSKAMYSLCKNKNGAFSFSERYVKIFLEEYSKKSEISETELSLIPLFLRVIFTTNFSYYSQFLDPDKSTWYFNWTLSACDSIYDFNDLIKKNWRSL